MPGSTPNWTTGYVPPASEWNTWWGNKADDGVATHLTLTGDNSLVSIPPSSPLTTYSSMVLRGSTTHAGFQQMLIDAAFVSNTTTDVLGANICMQMSTEAQAGSGGAWVASLALFLDSGFDTSTTSGVCLEIDSANLAIAYGAPAAGTGLGILFNGLGNMMTAAMYVSTATGTPHWYAGLYFAADAIGSYSIQDFSNANVAYDIRGTHAGVGIDTANGSMGGALRIRYDATVPQGIIGCVTAVGPNYQVIYLNSAAQPIIGDPANPGIFLNGTAAPTADNVYALGGSGQRFSAVWAANGTIQTSDPSLKTDVKPLPSVLTTVLPNLHPITFKWKDGGASLVLGEDEESYHLTEPVTEEATTVEMRNGVPVQVKKQVTNEQLAYDYVQVVDEQGKPVFHEIPGKPEKKDEKGNIIQIATPATTMPTMHPVPRMGKRKKAVWNAIPKEGQRTHWGWDASQVKTVFDELGMDFGGYVKAEDGTEAMRPDQMIPVLWKAVQELAAEVAALKK